MVNFSKQLFRASLLARSSSMILTFSKHTICLLKQV